jgi:transposase
LNFCYEAGPRGFALCRCLRSHRLDCILVPEPENEAMRDLIRARFQVGKQQHRARQQLKMYLLRHNRRYGGQTSWTPAHLRYLAKIKMPFPVQQIVFQEMLEVISETTARLERYDQEIERAVPGWRWEPGVRALMSLRGMAFLHAATLVAELGDFNRFAHPGQLMGYFGLVPSWQGGNGSRLRTNSLARAVHDWIRCPCGRSVTSLLAGSPCGGSVAGPSSLQD